MNLEDSAFSYKPGSSVFHKCPALAKILLLPVFCILVFKLHFYFAAAMTVVLFACDLIAGFSLREIFSDLKIIFVYAVMLTVVKVFTATLDTDTLVVLLRLTCMFLMASLLFRTSTSLQLRHGLEQIELAVRRVFHLRPVPKVSHLVALVVCFIPLVSKNWNQAKRAWFARGGRNSIKMYMVLLPVFFSVGMKQAYNTARAVQVRQDL